MTHFTSNLKQQFVLQETALEGQMKADKKHYKRPTGLRSNNANNFDNLCKFDHRSGVDIGSKGVLKLCYTKHKSV